MKLHSNLKVKSPQIKPIFRIQLNQISQKMEFPTNITKYLKVNEEGFIVCNGKTLNKQIQPNFLNEGAKMIHEIINQLGANSAKAQGLKQIITSAIKFQGADHRIYLKVEGNKAIGFLRTGEKKLFYHDNMGSMKELTPTCVLDIYVHESYQRTGIGKQIFEQFLKYQNKKPQKLAYDRPSPKLIAFLKRHYGLSKFIPQNNNFVIFDQYFSSSSTQKTVSQQTQSFKGSSLNRFQKFENKHPNQQMPLVEMTKQLNKTLNGINNVASSSTNRESKLGLKMEDSLSLLEKEMNRMNLKTPPNNLLSSSGKQLKHLLSNMMAVTGKQLQSNSTTKPQMKSSSNEHLIKQKTGLEEEKNYENNKALMYKNYTPWATSNNPIFRTTSNSYGNYYGKKQ